MPHTDTTTLTIVALAISRTVILALGALVTYYAYKAYRRTGAPGLRALAIGFGFVVGGSLVGGVLHFGGVNVIVALVADSVLTALGFVLILYSLYADE